MAKQKTQPFNLLYRFEIQKSNIDKVYEFVVFQGRLIVMGVMLLIILAFVYRFPLDKKLNDNINLSETQMRQLNFFADDNLEQKYNDTVSQISAVKKYSNLYSNPLVLDENDKNQIKFGEVVKAISEVNNESKYKSDIVITDYSFSSEPGSSTIVTLSGYCSTFPITDDFQTDLKSKIKSINDIVVRNLGGSQNGSIQFSFEINFN